VALSALAVSSAFGARPYRGGAVASAHHSASEAAVAMLNRGGNAIDAAVAAAFVLAVVDPTHSGLGGGGFALVYEAAQGRARALDFREVAPAGAHRDMFMREGKVVPTLVTDGALAVATPGAVEGYLQLLSRYGKLRREVILAPAIRAAREGFPVTPLYRRIAQRRLDCLRADPEASRIFLRRGDQGQPELPPIGTIIRQLDLARTLELISRQGSQAFYSGRVARAIEATVREGGGVLTAEDIKKFKVLWREPLEGKYRGHRILTMGPPSAGGLAVIQVLGVLELREPSGFQPGDPEAVHFYVEALRRAFAERVQYLGDPSFTDIPLSRLASPEHIEEMARHIDAARATPSSTLLGAPGAAHAAPASGEGKHTTHVSVLDRNGNAVALTTTINEGFGACLIARGTGILLNDQMDDFASNPLVPNVYGLVTGEKNAVAPGKKPLSSMSPTLVFQKDDARRVMLVVGAAGGPTIPTSVIQIISNVIDQRMDLPRATGRGRVHHQLFPDLIRVEPDALDPPTRRSLEDRGHHLEQRDPWGDAEAVMEDPITHLRYAAPDPRNEGSGMGQD
jgi:gamma-glutamyltranspeptidase/glutathione hydrolase